MIDPSRIVSLSSQLYHSSRLDLLFALLNCRSILNKFSHLLDFAAPSSPDITFIAESRFAKDRPDSVTFLAGYQLLDVIQTTDIGAVALSV